jgi:hypothetical protein
MAKKPQVEEQEQEQEQEQSTTAEVVVPDRPGPIPPMTPVAENPQAPILARREVKRPAPVQFVKTRWQHRAARRQWRLTKVKLGR